MDSEANIVINKLLKLLLIFIRYVPITQVRRSSNNVLSSHTFIRDKSSAVFRKSLSSAFKIAK